MLMRIVTGGLRHACGVELVGLGIFSDRFERERPDKVGAIVLGKILKRTGGQRHTDR
jgi:hypothetical protein